MSYEIPSALSAYHPGVGHVCATCGRMVVDAVETPGEPFRCLDCQPTEPAAEDDLTQAALADQEPTGRPLDRPTVWRLVAVIGFAVVALGIVFWWR